MNAQNPLLTPWSTPFSLPPFGAIEAAHFLPAFDAALAEHDAEIAAIVGESGAPTYANTIDALERAGQTLNKVGGVFWNLASTDSNEDLRAIERDISPRLARHYAAISLNADLFGRVAALYADRANLTMSDEQARLLELTYKGFVRTGAQLQGADRDRYAEIAEKLASLEAKFAQNVLADESSFVMEFEDRDLAGLSPDVKAIAAQTALEHKTTKPFALTLSRSSVEAFLSHGERRDLREDLFKAWIARGAHTGPTDNRPLIRRHPALASGKVAIARLPDFRRLQAGADHGRRAASRRRSARQRLGSGARKSRRRMRPASGPGRCGRRQFQHRGA